MITEAFTRLFSKVKLNAVYDELETGHDLLTWLQSEHFHQKRVLGKTLITPHDESLYEHLMECAKHASIYATNHIEGNPNIWKFFLTGFLHDIGKPGCTIASGKHLCMKGHGPVGSAIIENITSQDLMDTFNLTKADMADIATAVNYHMCGYHARFPINKGSLNIDAFSLLTPNVKDLICALRIGDSLAIQGTVHGQKEKDFVMSTQHQFRKAISEPISQTTFMTSHGTTKGVLIMIRGSGGQGKTTLSYKIRQNLLSNGANVSIFNRDTYMVNITRRYMNKDPVAQEDITGAIYKEALTYYVECNKKWAREINAKMKKGIEYELLRGNVVILDTLATMYMRHCDLIPEIAQHALRVAIWVHRSTAFTADEAMNRLGCTLEEQNNINQSRPQDFTNPIGKGLEWGNLVSITENESQDKNAYKRPHFTMTTGWSGLMNDQLEHLMAFVSGNYEAQKIFARPPRIDDTMNMSLFDLVRHLYSRGDLKLLKEFFEYNHYNIKIEEFEDTMLRYVIVIKYIDGINQLWKPKWAREARGRGYAISWTDDVYEIKSSLNRGAELLTKAHLEEGVNATQDIYDWKFDTLDAHQQTIVKMFNNKDDVPIKDAYITQKVDGSLLVVTYYPTNTPEHDLMCRYVSLTGYYHMKTDTGLYIPSTSGNVYMSDAMKCYFVTATAALCGVKITHSSSDAVWKGIKDLFAQKMKPLVDSDSPQQCSLVFEMVCKDRVTHNKKVHTELAISYPSSGLFFLGTCREGTYIPHYKQDVDIQQPIWRKIASTGETIQIMKDLDTTIKGKMSVMDLNLKWFGVDNLFIHPEGFVYMDHHICDDTPTYSKIKLPIYYKCHKFEFDRYSLKEFLAFPESVDVYFPILGRLRWYTTNISDTITTHVNDLSKIVEAELTNTSNTYKNAPAKAKKRFDIYFEKKKQLDKAILCKMITNGIDKEAQTRRMIANMTRRTFHIQNNTKDDELIKISKILLIKLAPWEPRYQERVNELVQDQKNQLMDQIYRVVMHNYCVAT